MASSTPRLSSTLAIRCFEVQIEPWQLLSLTLSIRAHHIRQLLSVHLLAFQSEHGFYVLTRTPAFLD